LKHKIYPLPALKSLGSLMKKFIHYGFNESHGIASDLSRSEAAQKHGTAEHLAAIVFIAFTYESALNHLGVTCVPSWEEHFERLSPEAKLALLTERAKLQPDFHSPPYQSFKLVFKIRNALAHPKISKLQVSEEQLKSPQVWPKPKWMSQAKGLSIESALADLDSVIDALQRALRIELPPRFLLTELVEFETVRETKKLSSEDD
jgi:hypothetical protein